MRKLFALFLIIIQLLIAVVPVGAEAQPKSDYDLYYPQLTESPNLTALSEKDMYLWTNRATIIPALSETKDPNRDDYLNLSYGTHERQKLDIYSPHTGKLNPVVFFIHGGSWIGGEKEYVKYMAPSWISLGYTVVAINYRYADKDPHPAQIEDCNAALKWVIDNISKYGGDPNNIAIAGQSAGGHLAALLVTGKKWHEKYGIDISKVKCWIPMCGIHDFNLKENYYNPRLNQVNNIEVNTLDKRNDASPVNYVTGTEPPSLILHGANDWLVPKTNSIELYNKLIEKGAKSELQIVRGYMHVNLFIHDEGANHLPTKIVDNFLAKYLPTDRNKESMYSSNYDVYYPQFVDTKAPLSELMNKDYDSWYIGHINHPLLSEAPDSNRVDYFDIAYDNSDARHKLDIHHKKGDNLRPVIFFIHGGGWTRYNKDQVKFVAPSWVSLGYTVVSVNYHLADPQNADPSKRNPHPAQIEDCAMALKWVMDNIQNYGGDPNNIAIAGISAGGHLTALLTTGTKWHKKYGIDMSKVKCWIPMSGIHDLSLKENFYQPLMASYSNALLGGVQENTVDSSPVTWVTGKEPPSLIIHGTYDWLVPITNSTELYKKLKEKGTKTELELVDGYGHLRMVSEFGDVGHKPTEIINKYLATYLPTDENRVDKSNTRVNIKVNNTTLELPYAQAFMDNSGSVQIPLEAVLMCTKGTTVTPDIGKGTVTIKKDTTEITLKVGDGKTTKIGNTIFVPLRFVAESFGALVEWIPETNTVVVEQ